MAFVLNIINPNARFGLADPAMLAQLRKSDETKNEEAKKTYKESAVAFAEKYKPKYMGFGIEVNILYEKFNFLKILHKILYYQ